MTKSNNITDITCQKHINHHVKIANNKTKIFSIIDPSNLRLNNLYIQLNHLFTPKITTNQFLGHEQRQLVNGFLRYLTEVSPNGLYLEKNPNLYYGSVCFTENDLQENIFRIFGCLFHEK